MAAPSDHDHDHGACSHHSGTTSAHQTMDEMEFQRGVWSAALDGETAKVEKYLKDGGNPDAPDSSGYVALHYASRNGHLDICKLLSQHSANVNIQTRSGGVTPLHRAAYCGHSAVVELLLSHGADPKICDTDGKSPLHKAAECGHEDTANILINADPALVGIKDIRGRTAHDCATDDVKQLLSATR